MLRGLALALLLTAMEGFPVAQAQVSGGKIAGNLLTERSATVPDAISMTTLGDRFHRISGHDLVHFSPDGSKFAFVTQKGDLETDTVEFSLWVFKTAAALTAPHAALVVTFSTSSNNEAISHLKWLQDNDTLVFLGEQSGEPQQLYRISVTTKKLEKLTASSKSVIAYAIRSTGDCFLYITEGGIQSGISPEMRRRGFFVTTEPWDALYANRPRSFDTRKELFVKTAAMNTPQSVGGIFDANSGIFDVDGLSFSPDGRYVLILTYAIRPPSTWAGYKLGFRTASFNTSCASGDAWSCPLQYSLLDVDKSTVEPLLNVPIVRGVEGTTVFAWTRQNTVLFVNTLLPLGSGVDSERAERMTHVYAVEVSVPSRKVTVISKQRTLVPTFHPLQASLVEDRFIAQPYTAAAGSPIEFRKGPRGWTVASPSSSAIVPDTRLSVALEQGINSPPRLVAQDLRTQRKAVLFELNPQFAQLRFGRVEIIRWKSRDGRDAEGDLYFPTSYSAGKRYPLVVQTHGNTRDEFWIDGPFTTAFAAQPLASKGFFVLQMGLGDRYDKASLHDVADILDTPAERDFSLGFLEGAIDELDRRGLIDRDRVGVTGFSRTVYDTLYALTHSSYHFGAAVAADGVDFGYVGCLFYNSAPLCEKMNGGPPFGTSLANWAKAAPTFNLDKVQTPLLLQAIGAPLVEWEILAGLRWLKKPVEMLNFYPEGIHELVKPQQRLLSQGSVVDWYCFWLEGEEDSDPAKAEQYARWRGLRKLQEQNEAKSKEQPKN